MTWPCLPSVRSILSRLPAGDGVIVRDDAGARMKVFFQARAQFGVQLSRQVNGHHVGAAEVGLEKIALDDARAAG